MIRIAVVGDLSLQDPARLEKAMAAAYKDGDMLVHTGDINPGFDVIKKYAGMGKPVYAVRGNHDTDWDAQLGWPKQWNHDNTECHMVGLDNSGDTFNAQDWAAVANIPSDDKPILIFVHKPLSTIVLPDGSESSHIMGEGAPNPDAVKLQGLLKGKDVLCIHGHYHGFSLFRTNYADCLIEGRGGAAPQIGYTLLLVTHEGWTLHPVTL